MHQKGLWPMQGQEEKQIMGSLEIFKSQLETREHDIAKVFDCDPSWPLCLYDFTIKNKSI